MTHRLGNGEHQFMRCKKNPMVSQLAPLSVFTFLLNWFPGQPNIRVDKISTELELQSTSSVTSYYLFTDWWQPRLFAQKITVWHWNLDLLLNFPRHAQWCLQGRPDFHRMFYILARGDFIKSLHRLPQERWNDPSLPLRYHGPIHLWFHRITGLPLLSMWLGVTDIRAPVFRYRSSPSGALWESESAIIRQYNMTWKRKTVYQSVKVVSDSVWGCKRKKIVNFPSFSCCWPEMIKQSRVSTWWENSLDHMKTSVVNGEDSIVIKKGISPH